MSRKNKNTNCPQKNLFQSESFFENRYLWQRVITTPPPFGDKGKDKPPAKPKEKPKVKEKLEKDPSKPKLGKELKERLTESPAEKHIEKAIKEDLAKIKSANIKDIFDVIKGIDFLKYGMEIPPKFAARKAQIKEKIKARLYREALEKFDKALEPKLKEFIEAYKGEAHIDPVYWQRKDVVETFTLLNTRAEMAEILGEKYEAPKEAKEVITNQILGLAHRSAEAGNIWNVREYWRLAMKNPGIFGANVNSRFEAMTRRAIEVKRKILAEFFTEKPGSPKALTAYLMSIPKVHILDVKAFEKYLNSHLGTKGWPEELKAEIDLLKTDYLPYVFDPSLLSGTLEKPVYSTNIGAEIDFNHNYIKKSGLNFVAINVGGHSFTLSGNVLKDLQTDFGMAQNLGDSKKGKYWSLVYTDLSAFTDEDVDVLKDLDLQGEELKGTAMIKRFSPENRRAIALLIKAMKDERENFVKRWGKLPRVKRHHALRKSTDK